MKLDNTRQLEWKTATVQAEQIERLLAMGRAERRRAGVKIPVRVLRAMLAREQAIVDATS